MPPSVALHRASLTHLHFRWPCVEEMLFFNLNELKESLRLVLIFFNLNELKESLGLVLIFFNLNELKESLGLVLIFF